MLFSTKHIPQTMLDVLAFELYDPSAVCGKIRLVKHPPTHTQILWAETLPQHLGRLAAQSFIIAAARVVRQHGRTTQPIGAMRKRLRCSAPGGVGPDPCLS